MEFQIVSNEKNEEIRKKYISQFVNTETEHYKKYIATLNKYPDGMCYDGYLWDSLKADYKKVERSMDQALSYLQNKQVVLVMWDIYSNHRVIDYTIFSNNYPKDTIIKIDSYELCQHIKSEWGDYTSKYKNYLPDDIYIFDETLEWTVIFTHEGYDNFTNPELAEGEYVRICFIIENRSK